MGMRFRISFYLVLEQKEMGGKKIAATSILLDVWRVLTASAPECYFFNIFFFREPRLSKHADRIYGNVIFICRAHTNKPSSLLPCRICWIWAVKLYCLILLLLCIPAWFWLHLGLGPRSAGSPSPGPTAADIQTSWGTWAEINLKEKKNSHILLLPSL